MEEVGDFLLRMKLPEVTLPRAVQGSGKKC